MVKCYILKLSDDRIGYLTESTRFSEAVDDFEYKVNSPLVCFVINKNKITHIAIGNKCSWVVTGKRRLILKKIVKLNEQLTLSKFKSYLPKKLRSNVEFRFSWGQLMPPKTSEEFINAIIKACPETENLLSKYTVTYSEYIKRLLTPDIKVSLAYQKEAIATAFNISGISRDVLKELQFQEVQITSFLDLIPRKNLMEDEMILRDSKSIPGYEYVKPHSGGEGSYQNSNGDLLTVIIANKQPLEKQTGADLIYINESLGSLVLVQYKAMNKGSFAFPQAQLTKEIERMDEILEAIYNCEPDTDRDGFRFNLNPFFLKFCPRIEMDPLNSGLSNGMYVHLDHWKLIQNSPETLGPKNGRSLTRENIGRHLNNETFVNLVTQSWVGTNKVQSSLLQRLIETVLNEGRAVVFASFLSNYRKRISELVNET